MICPSAPLVNAPDAFIERLCDFLSRNFAPRIHEDTVQNAEMKNSMGNHLRTTSESRLRYTVKAGDTPGNIASRMLGDVRYADLIVTINRAHTVHDATALGAQTRFMTQSRIELPSESEMEIYSRHYFASWTEAKKSWLEESATSVSSFLGKMRDAAHRGAEKLNTHSNPLSLMSYSRTNGTAEQRLVSLATGSGTTFNAYNRRNTLKMNEFEPDMPLQNQQRLFDAFINGTR